MQVLMPDPQVGSRPNPDWYGQCEVWQEIARGMFFFFLDQENTGGQKKNKTRPILCPPPVLGELIARPIAIDI